MKSLFSILLFLMIAPNLVGQNIPALSFEELDNRIRQENEADVLVVNFWATWCKPCIKELPYFDSLQTAYPEKKVKVLLVSLDMELASAEKYQQRKGIQSEVLYLDETDHNAWIDRISNNWSGAIPATLFIPASGEEKFHEGEFSAETLFAQVNQLLNP